jgi:hypothetical protein
MLALGIAMFFIHKLPWFNKQSEDKSSEALKVENQTADNEGK